MKQVYCPLICLLVVVCFHVVNGDCSFPGDRSGTTTVAETQKTTYKTDDLVMYECEKKGEGYIVRTCQASGSWTPPSRQCERVPLLDAGAIGGIAVAATNFIVAVSFIIYTKVAMKDEDKKEEGAAKNYTVNSDARSMTSESKDKTPKSRATSARTENTNSAQNSKINVNLNDDTKSHGNNEVMV